MGKEIALKFIQKVAGTIKPKSAKFLSKQARDIEVFGERAVNRESVSEDIVEAFTPFRRLSNKNCTLSDPKYFITKFEREAGHDLLPSNWQTLSETEKVNYVVNERYSRLVANKIMNNIKEEPIEHLFELDKSGNIIRYQNGSQSHCSGSSIAKGTITVHNHPGFIKGENSCFDSMEIQYLQKHHPQLLECEIPHGGEDISSFFNNQEYRAYVVDSQGHKFVLQSTQQLQEMNDELQRFGIGKQLERALNTLDTQVYPSQEKIAKINELYSAVPNFCGDIPPKELITALIEKVKAFKFNFLTMRKDFLKEAGEGLGMFKFTQLS